MIDQFKIDNSIALEKAHIELEAPEEAHVPKSCEISISYVYMREK